MSEVLKFYLDHGCENIESNDLPDGYYSLWDGDGHYFWVNDSWQESNINVSLKGVVNGAIRHHKSMEE